MTKSILHTLEYFHLFSYPPTLQELYQFLNIKTSEREFYKLVEVLINNKIILKKNQRIALSSNVFLKYETKQKYSKGYYQKALKYLSWLKVISSLEFMGISGSLSMLNTKKEGDIDLFVITETNRLWTIRFILLVYKYTLKLIDPHIANKLCFNLFFSKKELEIKKEKRNEYIAHELLQIKILFNKKNCYSELIQKNKWIEYIFPNINTKKNENTRLSHRSNKGYIEFCLRYIQKLWLKRKKIVFNETKGQIWFIQDDFEDKLPDKYRRLYQQSR